MDTDRVGGIWLEPPPGAAAQLAQLVGKRNGDWRFEIFAAIRWDWGAEHLMPCPWRGNAFQVEITGDRLVAGRMQRYPVDAHVWRLRLCPSGTAAYWEQVWLLHELVKDDIVFNGCTNRGAALQIVAPHLTFLDKLTGPGRRKWSGVYKSAAEYREALFGFIQEIADSGRPPTKARVAEYIPNPSPHAVVPGVSETAIDNWRKDLGYPDWDALVADALSSPRRA